MFILQILILYHNSSSDRSLTEEHSADVSPRDVNGLKPRIQYIHSVQATPLPQAVRSRSRCCSPAYHRIPWVSSLPASFSWWVRGFTPQPTLGFGQTILRCLRIQVWVLLKHLCVVKWVIYFVSLDTFCWRINSLSQHSVSKKLPVCILNVVSTV